jgi:tRNA(adenine34) deaminase
MAKRTTKRWSRDVKTISTYPPTGLFTKDATTIAHTMARKKVSPRGIGSGIRMVQFFINRAGKNLPPERRSELERAKRIMQARAEAKIRHTRRSRLRAAAVRQAF